ncbi:hypothetical protein ACHAPT_010764 [Fusarium lateritium]
MSLTALYMGIERLGNTQEIPDLGINIYEDSDKHTEFSCCEASQEDVEKHDLERGHGNDYTHEEFYEAVYEADHKDYEEGYEADHEGNLKDSEDYDEGYGGDHEDYDEGCGGDHEDYDEGYDADHEDYDEGYEDGYE